MIQRQLGSLVLPVTEQTLPDATPSLGKLQPVLKTHLLLNYWIYFKIIQYLEYPKVEQLSPTYKIKLILILFGLSHKEGMGHSYSSNSNLNSSEVTCVMQHATHTISFGIYATIPTHCIERYRVSCLRGFLQDDFLYLIYFRLFQKVKWVRSSSVLLIRYLQLCFKSCWQVVFLVY